MKKVVLVNTQKGWGGGEKWFFEAAQVLHARSGFKVSAIVHPRGRLRQCFKQAGIPYVTFRVGSLSILNIVKLYKLYKFFCAQAADFVIMNTPTEARVAALSAFWAGVSGRILRRGSALPVRASLLNRYLLPNVLTAVLTNSHWTARLLRLKSSFLSAIPMYVVHNGIHSQAIAEQFSPTANAVYRIGSIGRLSSEKGHHMLLDVAERLKAYMPEHMFMIHIAGEGKEAESLHKAIRERALEGCVRLEGFVSDVKGFIRQMDIIVHTAQWEGFGFVLIEAMAQGRPVVAFDAGSTAEIIVDGKTGFIVPQADVEGMLEKILSLRNTELRRQMGKAAIEHVRNHFVLEQKWSELFDILKRANT